MVILFDIETGQRLTEFGDNSDSYLLESELNLITPVSKFIHDAALKAFAEYAKEKWNVAVKVNAIPAGTPIAYGRIVEWIGCKRGEIDHCLRMRRMPPAPLSGFD